jgi:hypothetical protein
VKRSCVTCRCHMVAILQCNFSPHWHYHTGCPQTFRTRLQHSTRMQHSAHQLSTTQQLLLHYYVLSAVAAYGHPHLTHNTATTLLRSSGVHSHSHNPPQSHRKHNSLHPHTSPTAIIQPLQPPSRLLTPPLDCHSSLLSSLPSQSL